MNWRLHVKSLIFASVFLLAVTGAHAQVLNGNGNSNNNTGIGNGNGSGNGNGNGSGNTTTATATTGASTATAGSSSSNVHVSARGNTPAVVAPGLTAAGIESCLGSNSIGGAGGGVGVTIAGTVTDKGCNLRLFSRTLYNLGHRKAATQILCNDPEVAQALRSEGVHCEVGVGAEIERAAAANAMAAAPESAAAGTSSGPSNCMHYVLFRGCLDEPKPVVTADIAAPSQIEPVHGKRLAKRHPRRPGEPN
jgi:hypothetical protein